MNSDDNFIDFFQVPSIQRMQLLVNVSYQFKEGYEEFLDVFTDTKIDNIVPSQVDDKENM